MEGQFGRVRIGHYEIKRVVAQDGLTRSYQALDTRFNQAVLLKVLNPMPPGDEKWLHNEAALLRILNHPGIVRLLDYRDASEGGPFLVTELFLPYRTLTGIVKEISAESWPKLLRILEAISEVAEALAYCHSLGIIHRDIKPSHILVDDRDGLFHTKLVDFELGVREGHRDENGIIVGTPPYMSPEQWKSDIITHKSDVFSLGIVLFELLSGKHPLNYPYTSGSDLSYKHSISATQNIPIHIFSEIPHGVRNLTAGMLSLVPDARPSMREVHAELTSIALSLKIKAAADFEVRMSSSITSRAQSHAPGVIIAVVVGAIGMALTNAFDGGFSGGQGFLVGAVIGLMLTIVATLVNGEQEG